MSRTGPGLNSAIRLQGETPSNVSSSSSSASKLRSFFRTSSSSKPVDSSRPTTTSPSTGHDRIRTNSIYDSSLPISPATRQLHVGQSPSSRPPTIYSLSGEESSTPKKKKEQRVRNGKNLSIWSLSPSISSTGGGNDQSNLEDGKSVSTTSRPRNSRHESVGSTSCSPSRPTPPPRSLSCLAMNAPPSPPLDPHIFLPRQQTSSIPTTPQRNSTYSRPNRERSETASTFNSISTFSSTSTRPQSTLYQQQRLTPPPATARNTLRKTLSSLMLGSSNTSPSNGQDGNVRNTEAKPRRRRLRTESRGANRDENDADELTEEELKSWRLSSNSSSSKLRTMGSMEKLGSYDLTMTGDGEDGYACEGRTRRRTSSNRSFLDGPDFSVKSSDRRKAGSESDSEDDDEVLIIDRTKSKGFSTLLGGKYDELIPRYSSSSSTEQTPTTANFTFSQIPISPQTVDISPSTPSQPFFSTPATLRPPNRAIKDSGKRLSQTSTNSEEALWLDAANTTSFPSSPNPPPPAPRNPDSPKTKEIKQSVFSTSLVHPVSVPASPSTANSSPSQIHSTRRRESIIPLSPQVAHELRRQSQAEQNEGETDRRCTMPPSPPESDSDAAKARRDSTRLGAVEGLLIDWNSSSARGQ
ncbi:hypothetical protein JCM16303_001534 [Sporobolomyces ruberrimus]